MTLPATLFRYRPLSTYSLAELATSTIWFSSVGEFNDPFEFQFDIKPPCDTPKDREFIISSIHNETNWPREVVEEKLNSCDLREFHDSFEKPKQNLFHAIRTQGVCCFSARKDCPLMWGHYTGGHTGFVVGYDTSCFPLKYALPVKYEDKLCTFSIHDMIERMSECVNEIVTRKATEWSYEEEYRLVNKKDNFNVAADVDPAAIKSIYFGAKCTKQNRSLIGRIISHLRPEFYEAQLDKERYGIFFQELEYDPQF